jgi:hypothetical protein
MTWGEATERAFARPMGHVVRGLTTSLRVQLAALGLSEGSREQVDETRSNRLDLERDNHSAKEVHVAPCVLLGMAASRVISRDISWHVHVRRGARATERLVHMRAVSCHPYGKLAQVGCGQRQHPAG